MRTRGFLIVVQLTLIVVTTSSVVSARRAWAYAQQEARAHAQAAEAVGRQTIELERLRSEVVTQGEEARESFHAGAAARMRLVRQLQAARERHRACEASVTPGFSSTSRVRAGR